MSRPIFVPSASVFYVPQKPLMSYGRQIASRQISEILAHVLGIVLHRKAQYALIDIVVNLIL
jgi:hypothetical protein